MRCLLLGDVSLYSFWEKGEDNFFLKANDSIATKLIYSKEVIDSKIHENNEFKKQLYNKLKCSTIDRGLLRKTKYSRKYLLTVFEKYNSCKGSDICKLS